MRRPRPSGGAFVRPGPVSAREVRLRVWAQGFVSGGDGSRLVVTGMRNAAREGSP